LRRLFLLLDAYLLLTYWTAIPLIMRLWGLELPSFRFCLRTIKCGLQFRSLIKRCFLSNIGSSSCNSSLCSGTVGRFLYVWRLCSSIFSVPILHDCKVQLSAQAIVC
jgi:hypothetical protein